MDSLSPAVFLQAGSQAAPRAANGSSISVMEDDRISDALLLLNQNNSVPAHVKRIFVYLLDNLRKKDCELESLGNRKNELLDENPSLKKEKSSLKPICLMCVVRVLI
ncbi:unnamed protein product [Haemonchus placei]|uniref:SWIB domain-containing protein n=1 Tax=Haemonchus placei TaxID=6290 RepID=A0A0N4W4X8_HAEPC|nr:unnamed protein product [Haemonchus placei]